MDNSKNVISIVGMGFSGLMTAVHLVRGAELPFTLNIISKGIHGNRGPAYSTNNPHLVLNVPTAKMSCLPKEPSHFLEWIAGREPYSSIPKDMLAISFMPRKLYGEYLTGVWKEAMEEAKGLVSINLVDGTVNDVRQSGTGYVMTVNDSREIYSDYIVLATGNELPGDPEIPNMEFFTGKSYFRNPWDEDCTRNVEKETGVLIIGNGLTMVDTVLCLIQNGFRGTIYSISPNGFAILQHRHGGVAYRGLIDELKEPYDLDTLFGLFKKHVKLLRNIGISAEPVVDSVRGISQKIWLSLPVEDKRRFMRRLRHLWGVARHRIPINVYDKIVKLKLDGKLKVIKGRLINITQNGSEILVDYRNRKTAANERISVSRVINCTGPMTDITKSHNELIAAMVGKGLIRPDPLRLGIDADTSYRVLGSDGEPNGRILTVGSNLKGLLWESTAVPELRIQAEELAGRLLDAVREEVQEPV